MSILGRLISSLNQHGFKDTTLDEWSEMDNNTAITTLTVSGITVSLEFRFNHAGEVTGIYTPARANKFIPMPGVSPLKSRDGELHVS